MISNTTEILLVEDNKIDADLTIRSLKRRNINSKLIWVKDGAEALEYLFKDEHSGRYLKKKRPDLILLNNKMPKMNGLEVLKKIRSNKNTNKIPVIMLTSSEEEKEILQCYENGANSFITKPIDFRTFMDCVTKVISYWCLLNKAPIPR